MLGAFREYMRWHELAIAVCPGSRENAWASYGAGLLAAQQGNVSTAGPLLDRAAALARDFPDPELAAYVTDAQGSVAFYSGDNEMALERYGAALASFKETGFGNPMALICYTRLASACMAAFDLDRAIELCEECTRRCEAAGEQWARGTAVWVCGVARWMSGDNEQAIQDALASLRIKDALGDLPAATMCIDLIAACLAARGSATSSGSAADFVRAAELSGAGDAMRDILNLPLRTGPPYAQMREDVAARCRNALGVERFAAAHRRGMAMSPGEAIALARGEASATAAADVRPLTRREREIAALVAKGMVNREIAERLFLSKRTVDSHIEHIFAKLGFTSRTQLATWIATQG
jgi:non-specific serine/threonine protein kinase